MAHLSTHRLIRLWRHLVTDSIGLKRAVGPPVLDAIEAAIQAGERRHTAEIRVAFEPALSPLAVWRGQSARARALAVFGTLRVWDTEANNGVLVYVLLADRRVELIADRGAARAIAQARWDALAASMTRAFARGAFREGTLEAIAELNDWLAQAFPTDGTQNPDELPDRPALL